MNYKQQHIEVLLLACKKQDKKAQMELYQRFYKNTYQAAFRILKNSDDAMDAMQEAFIIAFQRLDQYSGEGSFGGWLHKIVVRKSIQQYHKNKVFVSEERLENTLPADEGAQERVSERTELAPGILDKALNKLNDRYQLILKLYYLEGYDYEEISEILNWSYANCRTTLSRAREQLKKQLNG